MRYRLFGLMLWMTMLLAAPKLQASEEPVFATGHLRIGPEIIQVEIADSPKKRQLGLMFRRELPAGRGMLFVFDRRQRACFWMRNTYIPLDVVFLSPDGRMLQIESMQAKTDRHHCAGMPVRHALELPAGWLKQRGLGVGDRVQGLAALAGSGP